MSKNSEKEKIAVYQKRFFSLKIEPFFRVFNSLQKIQNRCFEKNFVQVVIFYFNNYEITNSKKNNYNVYYICRVSFSKATLYRGQMF